MGILAGARYPTLPLLAVHDDEIRPSLRGRSGHARFGGELGVQESRRGGRAGDPTGPLIMLP
jgi:hypothetical protein